MNRSMNPLAAAMRSFVMTGFGEPLCEHRGPLPEPAGTEVLLKVDACGVCHSDLHVWEGHFDLGGGRRLDIRPGIGLPRALGHEIAGTVVAVGTDVDVGDLNAPFVGRWRPCDGRQSTAVDEHAQCVGLSAARRVRRSPNAG